MGNQRVFDLQLFAEGEEGYTIDQALEVLNGTQQTEAEPVEEPPSNNEQTEQEQVTEPEESQEETETTETTEPADSTEPTKQQEQPVIDYSMKIKFKANGQELEPTLGQLVELAQKGVNYDVKMRENAAREKSLLEQVEQQKKPEPPKEKSAREEAKERIIAKYGEFNQFDEEQLAELAETIADIKLERKFKAIDQEKQQAQQQAIEQQCEQKFNSFVQEAQKDANVTQFALDRLKEIEPLIRGAHLHNAVSKLIARDQGNKVAFIPQEIDALNSFYDSCKTEYKTKQTKEQVKAQVPKSVPIKPTVKVETTGNNEPVPTKKPDFKKMRSMEIDDIVKLL